MRTLTRQEAAERAALIAVEAYDVELDFTTGATTFRSTTRLRFDCRQPGATTFVELLASGRPSVRLNGHILDDGVYDGERISLRHLDATNELVVEAHCSYTDTGEGMHRFVDPEDGETYLYSNAFLYEAQQIFACFDQPDLKATFELRVIAPMDWTVLANGAGSAEMPGHWAFEPTPRLSTYLVAVCAGPYQSFRAVREGIPLAVHCRRSMARYLEVDDMLGDAQAALVFFGDLFGRPYPFSKCDLVFVPEMRGAMENAACITFDDDDYIFRSPVTDVRRRERTEVIAHELAHMWFGDLVTMRWWDDLWLNESFASYLAALTLAEATRHRTAWTAFILGDKAWGYWADQLPTTHPISADVPDAIATMLNLDGISYSKGAGALKQLVAWVGFEPFTRGLRAYIAEHAWSNTTIDDLMAALEAASGRDLRQWTHEWLQTAGLATLAPVVSTDEDGRLAGLAIEQSAPADQPTLRSHRVAIGLYDRIDGRIVRRARIEVDIVGCPDPRGCRRGWPRPGPARGQRRRSDLGKDPPRRSIAGFGARWGDRRRGGDAHSSRAVDRAPGDDRRRGRPGRGLPACRHGRDG